MFLQLSPDVVPQASSYDPSLGAHQKELSADQQQQKKRSCSLDDRCLAQRERGGGLEPCTILAPHPPLDKTSQEQLDEFEEVISRMASMTRGSCVPPQSNGESPVSMDESSQSFVDKDHDNHAQVQGQFDLSANYPSDRYFLPQDVRGVGRVSTQVSPRSTPYPATTVSSPTFEASQANCRRGSFTEHGASRAAPQVKIQFSAPWEPPRHLTGLRPLV